MRRRTIVSALLSTALVAGAVGWALGDSGRDQLLGRTPAAVADRVRGVDATHCLTANGRSNPPEPVVAQTTTPEGRVEITTFTMGPGDHEATVFVEACRFGEPPLQNRVYAIAKAPSSGRWIAILSSHMERAPTPSDGEPGPVDAYGTPITADPGDVQIAADEAGFERQLRTLRHRTKVTLAGVDGPIFTERDGPLALLSAPIDRSAGAVAARKAVAARYLQTDGLGDPFPPRRLS